MPMRLINTWSLVGTLRRHWHAVMLLALLGMTVLAAEAPRSTTSLPMPATATSAPPAVGTSLALFLPMVQRSDNLPVVQTPTAAPPTAAPPTATLPATAIPVADLAACIAYRNIRITWYELNTCCGKPPGHPEYGITRSGLPVQWGMAAVQARHPLFPIGTRFIVGDIGPRYVFTVTDTGSETAFGSTWIDIYAPSVELGLLVERTIGRDGRSDVFVCPEA